MTTNANTAFTDQLRQGNERVLQVVNFRLAGEIYGIPITQVREIILVGNITRIPRSPPQLRGVINLRKQVIPVIDLRVVFGLPEIEIDDSTRILVVQVGSLLVGVLVDAVCEVLRIPHDEITPPPVLREIDCRFLTGLSELNGKLIMIIDMARILSDEDLSAVVHRETAAVCGV